MAVVMAQAGLHVPCASMVYSPYSAIFTRIVNRDDLFRGLSTFAMEMAELRTILLMNDRKSLILGDELCSGTENVSAISIFVASLEQFVQNGSSFVFATHFHELQQCDEVTALQPRLGMKHMKIHYDAQTQKLVYDRKLAPGCGDAMYGLEVCRSLNMPTAFLERAIHVRSHLKHHSAVAPSTLSQPKARYSAKKLVGKCERCNASRPATETHHVVPQHLAQPNGYIVSEHSTFHKDHPANLMSLCEACHLAMHHSTN
jgi:DNA mismatch repair protein MutS